MIEVQACEESGPAEQDMVDSLSPTKDLGKENETKGDLKQPSPSDTVLAPTTTNAKGVMRKHESA